MTTPAAHPRMSVPRPAGATRRLRRPEPQSTPTRPLPICPYLLAEGKWKSARATREHRCEAVEPPAPLSLDKQRRLCLGALHLECPTYAAARAARTARLGGAEPPDRLVRTTPVVVERSRPAIALPEQFGSPRGGQAGLVALMIVALVSIALARLPGNARPGATSPPPAASPSSASAPAAVEATPPTASASPVPTATAPPRPSSTAPGAPVTPSSAATRTYRVKAGDTLIRIAAQNGVSVAAIQRLNGIGDPRTIRIGQILNLPPRPSG